MFNFFRYLVTTVKFGPTGVVHNYGLPKLTKYELKCLEKAAQLLHGREELAHRVLQMLKEHPSSHVSAQVHISHFQTKDSRLRD